MQIQDVQSGVFRPPDHQSRLATITREGLGYQNGPNTEEGCRAETFLGFVNYRGKFLLNLSTTLSPLYKLLKKSGMEKELRTIGSCEGSEENV